MSLVAALLAMLVAAAATPALARRLGRNTGYPLAVVFLAIGAVLASRAPLVLGGGTVTFEQSWLPTLGVGLRLRLDGLSLLFVVLVLGVGALILSYCARYLSRGPGHGRLYLLLVLFATSMLGLVLSADLVLMFVFWELTTLCSFLLIGGPGLKQAKPATRAFVITGSGGLALLGAVILMADVAGTTDLSQVLAASDEIRESPQGPWIAGLIILAAFTKSAQFPFHFWLPDAMVAITPVSAYLHAATLVKGGIYLLLRFSPPFAGTPGWTLVLISFGLTTAVVGAVFALQQHDLKALLAYSTVSQLGWIVALIGVGTTTALAVAALHTFAHALFKATLFMLVGIIDREAGSRDIRNLSGLFRVMPITATLTALAALSMAGLPPFLGFVSKEEAYYAFLELNDPTWSGPLVAGIAVGSAALTFAYGFRILYGAFGGPTLQYHLYEPKASFLVPAAIPAVAGLALGLGTAALNPLINRTVQDTLLREGEADLALWHGFTPALWLSVLTISIGVTLFLARGPVDRALQRLDLHVRSVDVFDRLYDGAIALGSRVGAPSRSGSLAQHLLWPVLSLVALAGLGVAVLGPLTEYPVAVTRAGDWVLVALLAVAVLALVVVHDRIAAIGLLGVVGLVVAAWFVRAGAPDLALTQVLVEILTVVVAVLVLRRLPRRFDRGSRGRSAGAAVLAVVAGLAAGAATLVMTGRREISTAGQTLLDQGPDLSGGTNVVNTVLVDFRGLDTLGEAIVLAVAALGLLALLRVDRTPPAPDPAEADDVVLRRTAMDRTGSGSLGNATVLIVTARFMGPLVVALSLWLLLRGHYEPGGGFIAALVGGAGVALYQLPHDVPVRSRLQAVPLVAAGLVVSVASGLLGLLDGSFLRPLRSSVEIGELYVGLTTSLVFDVGVYLCVLGLVVAAVDRLGRGRPAARADGGPDREPDADADGEPDPRLVDDAPTAAEVVR